jgi:hypothetical protein
MSTQASAAMVAIAARIGVVWRTVIGVAGLVAAASPDGLG